MVSDTLRFRKNSTIRERILNYYYTKVQPIADKVLVESLMYISHIDRHSSSYKITEFDVDTYGTITTSEWLSPNEILFDFYNQSFYEPTTLSSDGRRIRSVAENVNEFEILVDNGWARVSCGPPEIVAFDDQTLDCFVLNPCEHQPLQRLPLRHIDIQRFVYNRKNFVSDDTGNTHPFMYLQCDVNGNPSVESCPDSYEFSALSNTCEIRNICENRPDGFPLSIRLENMLPNEYLVCENHQMVTRTCPGQFEVYNVDQFRCVNESPCSIFGRGFTFITPDLNDNQFNRCTSDRFYDTITCPERSFDGTQYICLGNDECLQFPDGTGTQLTTITNDYLQYDLGRLECLENHIVENTNCETEELNLNLDPFQLLGSFPSRVYNRDTNMCEPPRLQVTIQTFIDELGVFARNGNYDISYETSVRSNIERLFANSNTPTQNDFIASIDYTRDHGNALAINPWNGDVLDCLPTSSFISDIFNGNTVNWCSDEINPTTGNRDFIDQITLSNSQYLSIQKGIVTTPIERPCREYLPADDPIGTDIFIHRVTNEMDNSMIEFACLYSMPIFQIDVFPVMNPITVNNSLNAPECESVDLNKLINSKVILNNQGGCISVLNPNTNEVSTEYRTIDQLNVPSANSISTFNFETQSSDNIHYNIHLHRTIEGNGFIACHNRDYDEITETCSTDLSLFRTQITDLEFS